MDFDENLIVGEAAHAGVGQRQVHIICNALRQRKVAVACHQFHVRVPGPLSFESRAKVSPNALATRNWPDNRLAPLHCGQ